MIEAFYIDKSVATNFLKISMLAIAAICDCFYLHVFSNSKLHEDSPNTLPAAMYLYGSSNTITSSRDWFKECVLIFNYVCLWVCECVSAQHRTGNQRPGAEFIVPLY